MYGKYKKTTKKWNYTFSTYTYKNNSNNLDKHLRASHFFLKNCIIDNCLVEALCLRQNRPNSMPVTEE